MVPQLGNAGRGYMDGMGAHNLKICRRKNLHMVAALWMGWVNGSTGGSKRDGQPGVRRAGRIRAQRHHPAPLPLPSATSRLRGALMRRPRWPRRCQTAGARAALAGRTAGLGATPADPWRVPKGTAAEGCQPRCHYCCRRRRRCRLCYCCRRQCRQAWPGLVPRAAAHEASRPAESMIIQLRRCRAGVQWQQQASKQEQPPLRSRVTALPCPHRAVALPCRLSAGVKSGGAAVAVAAAVGNVVRPAVAAGEAQPRAVELAAREENAGMKEAGCWGVGCVSELLVGAEGVGGTEGVQHGARAAPLCIAAAGASAGRMS